MTYIYSLKKMFSIERHYLLHKKNKYPLTHAILKLMANTFLNILI